MNNKNILISGAGIAGPTVAYWLKRYGFNPTVVERSPKHREGGYVFGLDGRKGIEVLERMGVWPTVYKNKYEVQDTVFVDEQNNETARLNTPKATKEVTGKEIVYMKRSELARVLYEYTKESIDYLFGDHITKLNEDQEGVEVGFESGKTKGFDLVIGADGLHSAVRTLTFGDRPEFKKWLGHYVSAYHIPDYPSEYTTVRMHPMVNKIVAQYPLKEGGIIAVFIWRRDGELSYDIHDSEKQKQLLYEEFANEGWKVPKLLKAMKTTNDFYFDTLTQIHMPTWSKGRIALVGDAAYCPTLMTGYGSQLAMVGAYILAGELKLAGGDYKTAFQDYDKELRSFVEQKQGNTKLLGQLVPGSAFGLWARNYVMKLMANPAVSRFMVKMTYGQVVKEEITLKDYDKV